MYKYNDLMKLENRIKILNNLAQYLIIIKKDQKFLKSIYLKNPWFTIENITYSLEYWIEQLQIENLDKWISTYKLNHDQKQKKILIIMAGNIPLVGFHDLLCVIITGNIAIIKPSSKDSILINIIVDKLKNLDIYFNNTIEFIDSLSEINKIDFLIASGSNLTAKYFDFNFSTIKRIIRGHRNSVAILDGSESHDDLKALAYDIFTFFGLGCRNISKLYVPKDYDFSNLSNCVDHFSNLINHDKYMSNYNYYKSYYLALNINFLDKKFFLLKEDNLPSSPIGVVNYEFYNNLRDLNTKLDSIKDVIQCVVCKQNTSFGNAQKPNLDDYADNIDTINFLLN